MASVSRTLWRIKQDLQPFLPEDSILAACRELYTETPAMVTTYNHDAIGTQTGEILPNGITNTRASDTLNRLTAARNAKIGHGPAAGYAAGRKKRHKSEQISLDSPIFADTITRRVVGAGGAPVNPAEQPALPGVMATRSCW
jgi:hypothetical protein